MSAGGGGSQSSSSSERRAWVLNLDAEHELGARGRYAPTAHLCALVARERERLLGNLVAPDDVVVTEESLARSGGAPHPAAGLPGVAWSPTPRALALLAAAGARPAPAPSLDVLRVVNERPFAARVRAPLAGIRFAKHVATTLDEALARLASRPGAAGIACDAWLVRRAFGAAGRGRRRLASGRPDQAERAWLVASLRLGPLVIEPWVVVTREHSRSAWVERDGRVVIAPPCFQQTTRAGAWVRTERCERGALARADDARLAQAVERAGAALAQAGYFGPFGIDAFHHRGARGEVLNPLSEINARFTMDWTTGMDGQAPDAAARARLEAHLAATS